MYDKKEKRWISSEPDRLLLQRYRKGNLPDNPSDQYLLADWLLTDLSQGGTAVADAVYLMEQAANAGNPDAAFSMGGMFEYGHAVGKDLRRARQWYEKAALLGHVEADTALRNLRGSVRRRILICAAAFIAAAAAGLFLLFFPLSPSEKSHPVLVHKDTEVRETSSISDFSADLMQMIAENDDSEVVSGNRSSNRLILKYRGKSLDLQNFPASSVTADDSGLLAVQFSNEADTKACLDSLRGNENILYAMEDCYREYKPDSGNDDNNSSTIEKSTDYSRIFPKDDGHDYIYTSPHTGLEYYSWGVELMGLDVLGAWLQKEHTEPVVVAVIDTGTVSCEETKDRILEGFSPFTPEGKGWDIDPDYKQNYHGTHVAGIILDCTRGLDVRILPIRYTVNAEEKQKIPGLSQSGSETVADSTIVLSIEYAIDQNVDVINMSLGCFLNDLSQNELKDRCKVLREAYSKGIILVTSSGNDDDRTDYKWPAYYEDCLVVGAIGSDEKIYDRSNHGDSVDVCAPGIDIRSNVPQGYFCREYDKDRDGEADKRVNYPNACLAELSGTSMAAPHISALAAMLKLYMPDYSPAQIEQYIKDYCRPLGNPLYYGAGLPDAAGFADQ